MSKAKLNELSVISVKDKYGIDEGRLINGKRSEGLGHENTCLRLEVDQTFFFNRINYIGVRGMHANVPVGPFHAQNIPNDRYTD